MSDCTAEALSALSRYPLYPFPKSSKYLAIDILLGMQNRSGGFASYELQRGSEYLEWLNPADVFGGIMVEYAYVECTAAVVLALVAFRREDSVYRSDHVK